MNKLRLIALLGIAIGIMSCQKTIELDLNQTEEIVIIEGLITNESSTHPIKITKTVPFNSSGVTPRVSGAQVQVTDDLGNVFDYTEKEPGIYEAVDAFEGAIGRTYTMEAVVEEKTYTASEQMFYVAPFDKLEYRIDLEEQDDPEDEGRFYEILVFIKEPRETEDFYLIKFYRNEEILNDDGEFVFVYDDVALGEDIDALPVPFYYALDDMARVEMYRLTERAHRYFVDLANNIGNDGGMFSGQPANTSTNIEGGALGYFQVSAVSSSEIRVQ